MDHVTDPKFYYLKNQRQLRKKNKGGGVSVPVHLVDAIPPMNSDKIKVTVYGPPKWLKIRVWPTPLLNLSCYSI